METSEQFVLDVAISRETITGKDVDQKPEAFTEQYLIDKLLDALGFKYKDQAAAFGGSGENYPDFKLEGTDDIGVIGENKSINKWDEAPSEVDYYLDKKSVGAEYGIATDGMMWSLHRFDEGSDKEQAHQITRLDLQPIFVDVARDMGTFPANYEPEFADPSDVLDEFIEWFEEENFQGLISSEIPQWIREEQKEGVDEFFNLFIQLLFGEGSDKEYSTSLVEEIIPPDEGASDEDKNMFSVVLANRLIFVKLLEEYGIVPPGFLFQRLRDYGKQREAIAGNFYDTQLKPLFYSLLNTPPDNRHGKHKSGWFSDVPYLNGGLFRETVSNEYQYSVSDYILKKIIRDLIEGHRLQKQNGSDQLDPSILGKVFEKTITYLEHDRDKKDIGAYYTPTDVTRVIISRTLDRKVKDLLVETFASHATGDTEAIEETMREQTLEEILRDVEQGSGWFGNPTGLKEAEERILNLKTADPACGSGHFLTSMMTAIYRVWEALYRGAHGGDSPTEKETYEARKDIALQSIYGVDIDPIAVEIAKLRLWLKVIEDIEWKPSYGPLPNIDMNITTGNSLVGLPIRHANGLPFWSDDVKKLAELRREHKYDDEGRKKDILRVQEQSVEPQSNKAFINQFNEEHEWHVSSHEEIKSFLDRSSPSELGGILKNKYVNIKNLNGDNITSNQEDYLDGIGFTVYKKVAKLKYKDLVDHFVVGKEIDRDTANREVFNWIYNLEERGLTIKSISRRPTKYDLENMVGKPFHWPVIFPELSYENDDDHSIHFDIIVGNPPYGDILNKSSKLLLQTYVTGDFRDVSAPFIERQLQLLSDGGYFGNIATAKLVYSSDIQDLHNILRHQLEDTHIACFAKRPMKVFSGAEVRTSIFTGKKTSGEQSNQIRTSGFIRFNKSDRERRLRSINYEAADPYVLTDSIGGDRSQSYALLPKVGNSKIKSLLQKWNNVDKQVRDFVSEDEDNSDTYPLYYRRGNDYWLSAMINPLYDAETIKKVEFISKTSRNAAFITIHSSTFYLYWMVYGDQFHLNKGMVKKFPFFDVETIDKNEDKINSLKNDLWYRVKNAFNKHTKQFEMKPVKNTVDKSDDLLGKMFNLDDKLIEYAKEYQKEYRMSDA